MKIQQLIEEQMGKLQKTRFFKEGGSCFECCEYEEMCDDLKSFFNLHTRKLIEALGSELIGKDNTCTCPDCLDMQIRNLVKKEQRLKLKKIISSFK